MFIPTPGDEIVLNDEVNYNTLLVRNEKNIDYWENLLAEKYAVEHTSVVDSLP